MGRPAERHRHGLSMQPNLPESLQPEKFEPTEYTSTDTGDYIQGFANSLILFRPVTNYTNIDTPSNNHKEKPINLHQQISTNNNLIFTTMAYVISDDCIACGTCIDECPVGAISEGDKYSINPDACTECGTCADVCPSEAIHLG